MQFLSNLPPGYLTGLLLALLAVVAALGLCLAVVWFQLQNLESRHRQLSLQINAQLRDQFAVFNAKLSGQLAKLKRDVEGGEQKLESAFQAKLEVLDALSEGLKALERRIGRLVDTRSASGFLADLKESAKVFEILEGGRKRGEPAAPASDAGPEPPPIEKTSTGNT